MKNSSRISRKRIVIQRVVADHRPQVNIDRRRPKAKSGYGRRALLSLNLVVESQPVTLSVAADGIGRGFQVKYQERKNSAEKLGLSMATMIDSTVLRYLSKLFSARSLVTSRRSAPSTRFGSRKESILILSGFRPVGPRNLATQMC